MRNFPPITRYLLLTNIVVFMLQWVFEQRHIDLSDFGGLHFILADRFNPLQLFTYMFMHASLTHLFFNMFALWMFGGIIERTLGQRRFLLYYFVCGVGAGLCQELWQTGEYFIQGLDQYQTVNTGQSLIPMSDFLNQWTTIGASGACYGVLLAFGRLYPNERIMMLIPPIPMKAKYFVAGYAVIELVSAFATSSNIAHFAHLGGMLFGWGLLAWWRRRAARRTSFSGWGNRPRPWRERLRGWTGRLLGHRPATSAGNARRSPSRGENFYEENMRSQAEEKRMDEILDKVRRSGYDSLSREEKNELFRISRR